MIATKTLKEVEHQVTCINLNLLLAEKWMNEGKAELATHRIQDARKSLEELFEDIKKAN